MKLLDRFLGRGEASVTVPPMDGALQPNTILEDAPRLAALEAPGSIAVANGRVLLSDGLRLVELGRDGSVGVVQAFDQAIVAIAANAAGEVAVAFTNGAITLLTPAGKVRSEVLPAGDMNCITALLFETETVLLASNGSAQHVPAKWKHDLMNHGASGSVWRLNLETGERSKLADRLSFPYGLARTAKGEIVVSESWRHRLVRLDAARTPLLGDLPGYPSRIAPASDGGFWLCVFAPRSQLIEFVLQQKNYRREMMAAIEPELWIAPSMHAPHSFREPLQGGALKHLGILKPWAPTRSYGLVVKLDAAFEPIASFHSRADGVFHGVTECVEFDGALICVSQGALEVRSVQCNSVGD